MAVVEDKTQRALANKQKDLRHHLQVNWGRSVSHSERLHLQDSSIDTPGGITLQEITRLKILLSKGPPYHFLARLPTPVLSANILAFMVSMLTNG